MTCVRAVRECIGCGDCRVAAPIRCDGCARPIGGGEYYYDLGDRVWCGDCLDGCVKEA